MRAVRIHRCGGPEVLLTELVPEPRPGRGELLVRLQATSLNRHDVRLRRGEVGYSIALPATLGIDVCGEVVEVGAEVGDFEVGDRVVNSPWVPCGRCGSCRRGRKRYCTGGYVYQGSYAEYAVMPAEIAARIGATVPAEVAACLPNAYVTAWQMLVSKAKVGPGDVVFVWAGTSGLGSAAVEIARLAGATVITTAGSEHKLAAVVARGADACLDHHSPDLVERVLDLTAGLGATIVFEHVGQATWARSLMLCAPGGTIVSAGATSGKLAETDISRLYHGQIRVLGSRTGTMADLDAVVRHANSGHLHPLIDQILPLDGVRTGHRNLEAGSVVGKVVIRFDGGGLGHEEDAGQPMDVAGPASVLPGMESR